MRWLIALLVTTLIALSGCGTENAPGAEGSDPKGSGEAASLDFTGTTLDGQSFDGASLEGKPAVLWFWAPWCPTCRAQIGTVSEVAETHEGEVAVVGVGGLDSKAAIEELAAEIPHVTHLVDPDGAVWKHFGVTAQSTYVVIDADGELVGEGYMDNDKLVELADRLAG
jgi:thiol-disulfide isomerase/thioredoxin